LSSLVPCCQLPASLGWCERWLSRIYNSCSIEHLSKGEAPLNASFFYPRTLAGMQDINGQHSPRGSWLTCCDSVPELHSCHRSKPLHKFFALIGAAIALENSAKCSQVSAGQSLSSLKGSHRKPGSDVETLRIRAWTSRTQSV